LQKKDKPILKTYTTDQEQSRSHEIKPIKTDVDQKRKLKTLKPVLATRQNRPETLLKKENLLNKKREFENLQIENQTQTQI